MRDTLNTTCSIHRLDHSFPKKTVLQDQDLSHIRSFLLVSTPKNTIMCRSKHGYLVCISCTRQIEECHEEKICADARRAGKMTIQCEAHHDKPVFFHVTCRRCLRGHGKDQKARLVQANGVQMAYFEALKASVL
jgi:hypothetical protein